jgi:hypothetical protein
VLLVIVLAAVGMVGSAGYAWEVSGDRRPARSAGERLLVAGGVSLAVAGVTLLVVGAGTDVFMLALMEGRPGRSSLGAVVFMIVAVAGPAALIGFGIPAARGHAAAARAGVVLAGAAYLVVAAEALLPISGFGDPGPSALGPATVGMLPVTLLLVGIAGRRSAGTSITRAADEHHRRRVRGRDGDARRRHRGPGAWRR